MRRYVSRFGKSKNILSLASIIRWSIDLSVPSPPRQWQNCGSRCGLATLNLSTPRIFASYGLGHGKWWCVDNHVRIASRRARIDTCNSLLSIGGSKSELRESIANSLSFLACLETNSGLESCLIEEEHDFACSGSKRACQDDSYVESAEYMQTFFLDFCFRGLMFRICFHHQEGHL